MAKDYQSSQAEKLSFVDEGTENIGLPGRM
jgi:hypothetical protein